MSKTIVINNREGLVQCQLPSTIKNLSGQPEIGRVITLIPGANLVDSVDLETAVKNPGFAAQFETKIAASPAPEQNPEKVGKPILELLEVKSKEGKKVPLVVEDKQPLAKLAPEVAKLLIEETLVQGTLRSWLAEEVRPEMAHVLSKRIAELNGAPEGGPAAVGM